MQSNRPIEDARPTPAHPGASSLDPDAINQRFRQAPPQAILEWILDNSRRPVLSTNFRPLSCALLHMVTRIKPDIPIIWVDSGYNTPATYRFAEHVIATLNLNVKTYTPRVTAARRASLYGGVPNLEAVDAHQAFTREVKLDPFQTAFTELQPDVWITGIRRNQTEHRKTLSIASAAMTGVLRIAPLFYWTDAHIENYLLDHGLPDNEDYIDPTKMISGRECGLQTLGG